MELSPRNLKRKAVREDNEQVPKKKEKVPVSNGVNRDTENSMEEFKEIVNRPATFIEMVFMEAWKKSKPEAKEELADMLASFVSGALTGGGNYTSEQDEESDQDD